MSDTRVLIVVPTLGQRLEYLQESLRSIRQQVVAVDIVVVVPESSRAARRLATSEGAEVVDDPGSLAAAINVGVARRRVGHEFVSWLNDDDILEPNSLHKVVDALDREPSAAVAFGACRYIDRTGREIFVSKAGGVASRILGWGPDLIPQPGMLVRAKDWEAVGGLDETYKLAFDLDFLLRVKSEGKLISVKFIVSSFRWHPDSLTVDNRDTNFRESERAKRAQLKPWQRNLSFLWEWPVRVIVRAAAWRVSRLATAN